MSAMVHFNHRTDVPIEIAVQSCLDWYFPANQSEKGNNRKDKLFLNWDESTTFVFTFNEGEQEVLVECTEVQLVCGFKPNEVDEIVAYCDSLVSRN